VLKNVWAFAVFLIAMILFAILFGGYICLCCNMFHFFILVHISVTWAKYFSKNFEKNAGLIDNNKRFRFPTNHSKSINIFAPLLLPGHSNMPQTQHIKKFGIECSSPDSDDKPLAEGVEWLRSEQNPESRKTEGDVPEPSTLQKICRCISQSTMLRSMKRLI